MQSGLYHKTLYDNQELQKENEQLKAECFQLSNQVQGLMSEHEAMQEAWAERDARQRIQDAELKDLMQRMQQGQMFTVMATTRITVSDIWLLLLCACACVCTCGWS